MRILEPRIRRPEAVVSGAGESRKNKRFFYSGAQEGLGKDGDPMVWSWVGLGAVLAQLAGWALGALFSRHGKESPGVQGQESFEDGGSWSLLLDGITGSLIYATGVGW